jgi:hypothetical protein
VRLRGRPHVAEVEQEQLVGARRRPSATSIAPTSSAASCSSPSSSTSANLWCSRSAWAARTRPISPRITGPRSHPPWFPPWFPLLLLAMMFPP